MRSVFAIVGSLLIFAGVFFIWPFIEPTGAQDNCSFGPVSNAQYRNALAEVKRLQKSEWKKLPLTNDALSAELVRRMDVIGAMLPQSIFGRIAATHAVVRGAGGVYLTTMADNRDVYAPFEEARSMTIIGYRIDLNRLGRFRIIRRWISIGVGFTKDGRGPDPYVSAIVPSLLYFRKYGRSKYHATCPALPSISSDGV